jgi:inorganic pyrophosphatase
MLDEEMHKPLLSRLRTFALIGVGLLLLGVGLLPRGTASDDSTEKIEPIGTASIPAATADRSDAEGSFSDGTAHNRLRGRLVGFSATEDEKAPNARQDVTDSPTARLARGPLPVANGLTEVDGTTIVGGKSLYDGNPARNEDGTVNVIVEIPAGTNAKWEVNKEGKLFWEVRDGAPRIVNFLPYPGNYGMIPNTLSPKDRGGDGDGLDVLILGPALPRGTVARVHLIGVMKFLDKGEQDDKILAVMKDTPLGQIRSLKELNESFPGVAEIVHLWFTKYKGPGKMTFQGWGDIDVVEEILQRGIDANE